MLKFSGAFVLTVSAVFIMAGAATAKDPGKFEVEVSGGVLSAPITLPGPVTMETVFLHDGFALPAPEREETVYQLRLIPDDPPAEAGEFHPLNLRYFPGVRDGRSLLSGDWDYNRYFLASAEFDGILRSAIASSLDGRSASQARAETGGSAGVHWYITAGGAVLAVAMIGTVTGRKLLFRQSQ
jgi:hypothetical protein